MKRRTACSLFLLVLLAFFFGPETPSHAQNVEGQIIASEYGEYQIWGSGTNTFIFTPASCQVSGGGRNFVAFTHGLPILIADPGNPAIDETVIAGLVNIQACSVQLTPLHKHIPPFYLTSGTGGLQEAINANLSSLGADTIILSAEWYRLGGSAATIASVTGNKSLRLEDITTTPATWYQWNGSQYVAVSDSGGVGSLNSLTGAVNITPANSNVTVAQSGSNIQIGFIGATGISSINGDKTPTQSIVGTGGISCNTAAGTTTCNYSGSAGSGTVGSGGPYNEAGYTPSTPGTSVQPESSSLTLPTGLTTSQINAVIGASDSRVHIQNGDAQTPFSNTGHHPIVDDRATVPVYTWNVKYSGAQCDATEHEGEFTYQSNVITDHACTTGDVGRTIIAVAPNPSGVPTSFISTVASLNGSNQCVLTSQAPFTTAAGWYFTEGHDDTAALADAFNFGYSGGNGIQISLPMGKCLTTQPIKFEGQNVVGQGVNQSAIVGAPGEDVLQASDPSQSGYEPFTAHSHMHDFALYFDAEIDASNPWVLCTDTPTPNTCTSQTPLYRPIGIGDVDANYPLNAQWIQGGGVYGQGAINGVATVTNGQAVVCIPTSSPYAEALPADGNQIIFPYQATNAAMFETTVVNQTGSGCATGYTGVTLAANWPYTSGTQQEWFSGTSIQNIQTAIPATGRTFPMTITLANPILPNPQYSQAGMAPFGIVQIDGEQCSYYGISSIEATTTATPSLNLTACAQNGSSAAAHSVGAFIFPLNPVTPTRPWPVIPTLNAGTTTPSGAEFYPAVGLGNAAIAFPIQNGQDYTPSQGPGQANWHDLLIEDWPTTVSAVQNPIGYQLQNDTAGIYLIVLPFDSKFENIYINDPYYGIVEGTPSTNTAYYFGSGFPTADGNNWDHITVQSAAYPLWTIGEGSSHWKNTQVFSQSGASPNNSWPGYTPAYSGGMGGWIMGGPYPDTVSCCNNNTGMSYTHFDGFYIEDENGALAEKQPLFQLDCNICRYSSFTPKSGGVTFVGGYYQIFEGGNLPGTKQLPIINFGRSNSFLDVDGLSNNVYSNTYGVGPFLNWGPGTKGSGPAYGNVGAWISPIVGNSKQPILGQTAETFATGNITIPYVNALNGYITPDEFNTQTNLDVFPMSVGWTFDDTAPISHSYTACNVPSSNYGCATYQFGPGGRIFIGPDQRIAAGPYEMYTALKTPAGPNSFTFTVFALDDGHAACTQGDVYQATETTTGAGWQMFGPFLADFTAHAGCVLELSYEEASTPAQVQQAFVDFFPVAQQLSTQSVNLNGPTIYSGSGAPIGCGTTYSNGSLYVNTSGTTGSMLYTCIGTTWTDIK